MTRLAPFEHEDEVPEYALETFRYLVETRGKIPGPSGILLRSPPLARSFSDMCSFLRDGDTITRKALLELAIYVVGLETSSKAISRSHRNLALENGVPEELLDRVGAADVRGELAEETAGLTRGIEGVIVRFTHCIVQREDVSGEDIAYLVQEVGERGLVELAAAIGCYLMAACILRVAGVEWPT